MMRRLFDLIIDTLLFLGDFICHMPSMTKNGCMKIAEWIAYVFTMLPFRISIIYRFRKLWYPAKSDFKTYNLTNKMKEWMNTDLGKYRWKIIPRLTRDQSRKDRTYDYINKEQHLCFRYKTDAVAFKLRWTE